MPIKKPVKKKPVKKKPIKKKPVKKKEPASKKIKQFTAKEEAFCECYVDCLNASEAARRAGYSEKTARAIGYENLTKPYIRERINKMLGERTFNKEEVLAKINSIANGDLGKYVKIDGTIDINKLKKDGNGHLIKKVTTRYTENGGFQTSYEFYSAHEALRDLGRTYRAFIDRVEDSGPNGGPKEVYNLDKKDYKKVREQMLKKDDC